MTTRHDETIDLRIKPKRLAEYLHCIQPVSCTRAHSLSMKRDTDLTRKNILSLLFLLNRPKQASMAIQTTAATAVRPGGRN